MLCRLCLLDSTDVLKIFEDEGIRLKIADVIGQHFWFMPKKDDKISNIICCTCWLKVDNFHQFYCFVQGAHDKLSEISSTVVQQDSNQNDKRSFKKEEDDDEDEWMNDTAAAEYVDVISVNEEAALSDIKSYKIENESKDSDDESKDDENEELIKDPIQSDEINQSDPIETKISKTTRSSSSSNNNTKKSSSLLKKIEKKRRGRPKKKTLASDSEEDLPLTQLLQQQQQQKPKRDKNEQSEWLKKSKEDDDKIAKYMKLKCEVCCDEFITFAQVKQHYRTDHNKKGYVVCCNKKLYKRVLLLDHVNKHINPEYFKCDQCNKTFADKQCLKNHMLRHESDESKIFKCDQCPRKYAKQYLLEQHKFIHVPPEQRQFICDDCGKAFSTNNLLQTHVRYVHQNAYGKMCHICAKVIRGRTMFEKHQLEHAGVVPPKVQCKKCGAWLKHEYSLKKHMRRHMESLTVHKCEMCGKIAPSRGALRSHLRYVHEAERTYQCGVCNKAFKKAITLKEHMTTHTGEVLYTCPHCPRTFNSSANMHSHRKKVHRKEWEETRRIRGVPENEIASDKRQIPKRSIKNDKKEIEQSIDEIVDSYESDGGNQNELNDSNEQDQYLIVLEEDSENVVYRSGK